MNVTFNLSNVLVALSIIGALLVVAHQVGKWTQSVMDMLKALKEGQEKQATEIISLRVSRHEHGEDIAALKQGLEGAQKDIGDLWHRRKDDPARDVD